MVKGTHHGSVKDGGAETSRRATAPRRQPPHVVEKRWRQSPSLTPHRSHRQSPWAVAQFLSKKGKHVRREAGLPRARRVPNTSSKCNMLGNVVLTLGELRCITKNFSNDQLVGEGAFGKVYKGVLTNGDMIAVKRFASTITGLQDGQYENEAEHLMRLKHPNIVQLVGYCSETMTKLVWHNGTFVRAEETERLLCLEYMPKGSLRDHLSDETSGLEWNTRYKIIEGICYGLHYLHEEWQATPIIHMDLKPANILLDDNMVPKVADFGLSRLFGEEQTRTYTTSSHRKGTLGYMAPEYLEKGVITKKFDIFSLGVIIIEIITGLKVYPIEETETASQQYIDTVLNNWTHRLRKTQGYISDIDYHQINKCIQIGLLCVKFDGAKRPTINQIIKMLERSDEACKNEREGDGEQIIPGGPSRLARAYDWLRLNPLVGRESEVQKIDERITLPDRMDKHRVISVCGIAGVGKFSLVRTIYYRCMQQELQENLFGGQYAWVDVPQDRKFDIMEFCRRLILDWTSISDDTFDFIEESLKQLRQKRRLLLVIYGLQSKNDWNLITSTLKLATSRSCVLVVTSDQNVGRHCATTADDVCIIRGLKTDAALRLLHRNQVVVSSSLDAMGPTQAPVSSSLGAMGPLLGKLDLLLAPEYSLRRSLKHAVELLKEDLQEISAALMDQSMVDSPSHRAKYWMDEVRELSYDVKDGIDVMMSSHTAIDKKVRCVPCHRVGRLKIHGLPKVLKPSTRMARVAELRARLHEASERHERYRLDDCVSKPRFLCSGFSSRIPVVYEAAANLVGTEGSRKDLTRWLTDQVEQQLQVLCIVGSAGVGKTALAKELYRELGGQFDCRAFIRVSRTPDMSRLLGDLLSQLQRATWNSDISSVQNIIENIREHLQNKRYFIVIDELWEAEAWDIMNSAFPKGSNCSRIIITGEVKGVPAACCGCHSVNTFELKPLGSQDSEKLFFDRFFDSEHQCPDHLKELSCGILRKCGGLPLATITIGSLLVSEPYNSDLWHHVRQCFFSSLTNPTLEEMLKEIINICYSTLPQYLKTCLLYLAMYPEGGTICKADLLKQWITEGFISPAEGKEEIAESYFDELMNRGMIQPEQINHNGKVLSCTVHHIVFDLIMHKSREDNFITAIDYSQTNNRFSTKAHRLSLYFSCAQYAAKPEGIRLSKVRSLAFFGLLSCMPAVNEFKLLRVLILEFWGDYNDSSGLDLSRICRLFHLRYLKISGHISVELPSQIKGLKFLETLEIDASVSAVPIDIIHLPGLLHLSLPDSTELPDGIGRITSLQTLQYFDLGNNTEGNVRSLGKLINLRDLHLTCSTVLSDEHLKRNLVALASSLGTLANLKSLRLAPSAVGMTMFFDHSSAMFSTPMFLQRLELLPPICIFSRLPEWIGKLHRLRSLKIVVRVFLKSDIDILTVLPDLTVLSLHVWQPNVEAVIFSSGALPALKYLKYKCGALCVAFQEEALPNLQLLKLCFNVHRGESCSHMLGGIEHLLNLKEITAKIGPAAGAKEFDMKAAESAFKDAIRRHPRFPIYLNIKRVGWVEEEHGLVRFLYVVEEEHGLVRPDILFCLGFLVLVAVVLYGFNLVVQM